MGNECRLHIVEVITLKRTNRHVTNSCICWMYLLKFRWEFWCWQLKSISAGKRHKTHTQSHVIGHVPISMIRSRSHVTHPRDKQSQMHEMSVAWLPLTITPQKKKKLQTNKPFYEYIRNRKHIISDSIPSLLAQLFHSFIRLSPPSLSLSLWCFDFISTTQSFVNQTYIFFSVLFARD